jgi:putative transposase
MSFWRIYYHLVWATYDRLPLIATKQSRSLYDFIGTKCRGLGVTPYAIGGMPDHIHLVVSVPPDQAISAMVKQIKGSSSRWMNLAGLDYRFAWQREYGVFSLGQSQLEQAIKYVQNQQVHHADGTVIRGLERDWRQINQPTFHSNQSK